MSANNFVHKIEELVDKLNSASQLYYNGKESNVTDYEWDSMFDELQKLEKEYDFVLPYSPTKNVGYKVVTNLPKAKHKYSAKSLSKTKDINELKKWFKDNQYLLMSWKLDGLTLVATYEDGKLVSLVTRGDGEIGEDITHNAKAINGVKLTIPYKERLVLRGEAVISYENFDKINERLVEDDKHSTARNLAAGSVRQLDSKICKERNVDWIVFEVVEGLDNCIYKTQKLVKCAEMEFDTVYFAIMSSEKILEEVIESFNPKAYRYPVDGLVMAYNNIEYAKSLGETSKSPNHSIALKWEDTVYRTTITDIEWNTSRTGRIVPTAIFKAVDLDGANTTRATLNNIDYMNDLNIGIGDEVGVIRSNMVIPTIVENYSSENPHFEIPQECPSCNHKTTLDTTKGTVLRCNNPNCKAQLVCKLTHFASRDCMNIDGLSEATLEKFVEMGLVNNIVDIFNLEKHKDEIIQLEGFGIKSYNKLIDSIEKAKTCKLEKFINALGISNVGKSTSKILAKTFKTYDEIKNAQLSKLLLLKDVGDVTAKYIYSFFHTEDSKYADVLVNEYITFESDNVEVVSGGVFSGMKIYCTGTFANYKKDELKRLVESNGGEFASGYAKSLHMLVVGSLKGSSKSDKAIKDGVRVATEDEFIAMLENSH